MPARVTPLPHTSAEPTVELTGQEEWLSTLEDPHDTSGESAGQLRRD